MSSWSDLFLKVANLIGLSDKILGPTCIIVACLNIFLDFKSFFSDLIVYLGSQNDAPGID
jgi:hypothetical protein